MRSRHHLHRPSDDLSLAVAVAGAREGRPELVTLCDGQPWRTCRPAEAALMREGLNPASPPTW